MSVMFLASRMQEDEMKKIMEERRREKEEEKRAKLEVNVLSCFWKGLAARHCILRQFSSVELRVLLSMPLTSSLHNFSQMFSLQYWCQLKANADVASYWYNLNPDDIYCTCPSMTVMIIWTVAQTAFLSTTAFYLFVDSYTILIVCLLT